MQACSSGLEQLYYLRRPIILRSLLLLEFTCRSWLYEVDWNTLSPSYGEVIRSPEYNEAKSLTRYVLMTKKLPCPSLKRLAKLVC